MKILIIFLLSLTPLFSWAQYFGTKTHPMNKNTENLDILKYWDKNSPEELEIYESAFKVLSKNNDADFEDLVSNAEFLGLCEEFQVKILGGPILGQLSSNGISIWVRSLKPAKIEVVATNGEQTIRSQPVFSHFETDLTAIVALNDLKPSTSYTYKLIINDTLEVANDIYKFHTFPVSTNSEEEVRLAFGSCPHRWGLGREELFETINSRNPASMLLLGDIAVQDREGHIGLHRADYLLRDFEPAWRTFASKIPVYASWDDHDYFDNDDAGIPKGFTNEDRENVRKVFKNSWVNPFYGFEKQGKGIFTRTRIGPCDVIMTDNRYFRTGKKGSFLGKEQMDWLKEQLLDCKGPFIVLSCGTMWSDYVSKGKDSWGVNDPKGREELFQFIEDNNISGVLLISGDRHGARGFTIPRTSGFEFHEFGAASLGARAAASESIGKWDTELYGIVGEFAFGEFTFNTSGKSPVVTFRLIKESGEFIYEKTIPYQALTPKK